LSSVSSLASLFAFSRLEAGLAAAGTVYADEPHTSRAVMSSGGRKNRDPGVPLKKKTGLPRGAPCSAKTRVNLYF
jgi:hypothetical protein